MNTITKVACVATLLLSGSLCAQAASVSVFGNGRPGVFGQPEIRQVDGSLPQLGALYTTEVAPLPQNPTVLCVMMSCHALATPIVYPNGCELWIRPELFYGFGAVGEFKLFLRVPRHPKYVGLSVYMQTLVLDTDAPTLDLTMTPALQNVVGRRVAPTN